jgi:hypothetical protein
VSSRPGRVTCVSSNSVTVITPGAGSSTTSTATVSTAGLGGFIFAAERLGLALAIVRFFAFPRAGFDPLRDLLLNVADFLRSTFARFFRFAIVGPFPALTALAPEVYPPALMPIKCVSGARVACDPSAGR